LSLVGDSVDNIRGVAGIGEKTAAELLRQYGTMEHLLGSLPQIKKPKLRDALRASADRLRINRQVIALRCDLILPVTVDDLKVLPPDWAKLSELFQRFGFKSLLATFRSECAKLRTCCVLVCGRRICFWCGVSGSYLLILPITLINGITWQ